MRYNKPRRNRYRSKDRNFRRNGFQDMRASGINGTSQNFQRKFFGNNGAKAEKLLEKYNDLAKEALSSGDRILSESYYQHADHFLRVIENRNLTQNNPKPNLDNSVIEENSGDKIILNEEKDTSSPQAQSKDTSSPQAQSKDTSSPQAQSNEEI